MRQEVSLPIKCSGKCISNQLQRVTRYIIIIHMFLFRLKKTAILFLVNIQDLRNVAARKA